MKPTHLRVAVPAAILAAGLGWPRACAAQWSNPLLTEGVGSGRDLSDYYYHSGRAGGYGRATAPGDKNPAETLLREMNGTHYRQRTGRAYFRGRPVEDARRVIARQIARDRGGAQVGGGAGRGQPQRITRSSERSRRASQARQVPRRLPAPEGPLY